MEFFRSKIQTVKKKLTDKGLYDVRLVMLLIVTFIALSVFWNGAKIIQQNYELQQKVSEIEEENEVLELENRNKALQNEYLKTDEFADITARRLYGRAAPGERVYIVPRDVALGALSSDAEEQEAVEVVSEKPQWQKNLEAWLEIYFGS